MNGFRACLAATLCFAGLSARAQTSVPTAEIATAAVSLGEPSAAFGVLTGKAEWRTGAGRFAKLELRFVDAVPMSRAEVQSCEKPFADGVDLYANFDHTRIFIEGGKPKIVFAFASDDKPMPVTSLVFNFRYNSDFCVSSVRLYKGSSLIVVKAPTILEPVGGAPVALFDSRLETVWTASETGGAIDLRLSAETSVTRLRIWSGDQRSASKFKSSPRPKSLALTGEAFNESVGLEDKPGPQTIALKTAFKGKSLKIAVGEAYGGLANGAKIAELHFGNADGFGVVNVAEGLRSTSAARKSGFETAHLGSVVDGGLVATDESEGFAVRARSDGSFFMRGRSENLSQAGAFSFLGTYSIVESNAKRIRLKVDGVRWNPPYELDASVCGRECAGATGSGGVFLEDEISFGRGKDGIIFVRDEGLRRAFGLDFKSQKTRISMEDD